MNSPHDMDLLKFLYDIYLFLGVFWFCLGSIHWHCVFESDSFISSFGIKYRGGKEDECNLHHQYRKEAWMFNFSSSGRHNWGNIKYFLWFPNFQNWILYHNNTKLVSDCTSFHGKCPTFMLSIIGMKLLAHIWRLCLIANMTFRLQMRSYFLLFGCHHFPRVKLYGTSLWKFLVSIENICQASKTNPWKTKSFLIRFPFTFVIRDEFLHKSGIFFDR